MSDTPTPAASIRRTSSKVRETPEQRAKKRKIQLTSAVGLIAVLILIGVAIQSRNTKGAYIWVIGIGFGYILQRSRFCFTAALRDPILTGGTSLTKAVVIALSVASLGYMAIQIKATGIGLENLGSETLRNAAALPGNVRDVGVQTILGGFIFGIGAVIAGGCASGTFMRMGEGFVQQWIAVIFFIAGSVIATILYPYFRASPILYQATTVYLPQALGGWLPAAIFQFGMLFVVYILADWYGKKKSGEL